MIVKMGLRFHEKYLLLIGAVSLGLFLISGTLFYLSSTDFSQTHQNYRVRDLENIRRKDVLDRKSVV